MAKSLVPLGHPDFKPSDYKLDDITHEDIKRHPMLFDIHSMLFEITGFKHGLPSELFLRKEEYDFGRLCSIRDQLDTSDSCDGDSCDEWTSYDKESDTLYRESWEEALDMGYVGEPLKVSECIDRIVQVLTEGYPNRPIFDW